MKSIDLLVVISVFFCGIFLTVTSESQTRPDYCNDKSYKDIPLSEETLSGSYMRVHPSGDFVIISSNGAKIIDLREAKEGTAAAKVVQTPMNDEAYPIEPNWSWISSPRHYDKTTMKYFSFNSLLEKGQDSPSLLDDDHNQWYQSCAELPDSTKQRMHFRTALYTDRRYRDYKVSFDDEGHVQNIEKGPVKTLCANLPKLKPGDQFSKPTLSKDGTELSFYNDITKSTQIYRIHDNDTCTLEDDLGFSTSKVSFGYPEKDKKGKITFYATVVETGGNLVRPSENLRNGVFVYDRDTKETLLVSRPWIKEDALYAGFTKDNKKLLYKSERESPNSNYISIVDLAHFKVPTPDAYDPTKPLYSGCSDQSATDAKHTNPEAPQNR